MKKNNRKRLLLSICLAFAAYTTISAQLLPGYLSGMATIGGNPTLLNGNLIVGNNGELFLGTHIPRLQQSNTLYLIGEYRGEAGARTYHSVVNNTNTSGTRGFINVIGTANGSTEIMLDMFDGWDGSCIDLARAYTTGSDINAFTMAEGSYNGHRAYLKNRVEGGDRVWFLAERMIIGAYLSPSGQSRCLGGSNPFDALSVQTPTNGNYLYQWYKKSGAPTTPRDFSSSAPVGSANGGQTASYTPQINTDTTFYYFCVVRNANCSEYNIDTTDVSGAITMHGEPKIHIYGANLCIGKDTIFTAEIYEGDDTGAGYWHISEGLAVDIAKLSETTAVVTGHSTGKFTACYHYTTPGGCTAIVTSEEYEVFAKPVAEVQDIVLCSPQLIPASALVKNVIDADYTKIYDSTYTEITGQNIQANYGTATYYVEAIKNDCHCVSQRVAVHLTVTDSITFDLPAATAVCEGSGTTIDLADLVTNVNVSDYRLEVYKADGTLLSGTLVAVSEQPYYVKVVSNGCSSAGKGILVSKGSSSVRIVEQPQVQSYSPDDRSDYVNFYVVAEGALSYQWYEIRNGVTSPVAGAASDILTISVADIDPNVSYFVSVSGGCGAIINSQTVYAEECILLIMQKKNHTLIVNNNSSSNGGYNFTYYKWYKNGDLIHQGVYGADLGGIYNTGGSNLNPGDAYYVIATDQYGKEHRTCPYNPVIYTYGTRVVAYPNPTTTAASLVAVDVETDDEELLENGIIISYNTAGQYLGQVRANGHRVTPVQLPPVAGIYILKFVSGEFEKEIKIIVQ